MSSLNNPISVLPDLTAGLSLPANTAAPSDGWIFFEYKIFESYSGDNIDTARVFYFGGSNYQCNSFWGMIGAGSYCSHACTFYPCRR